jgi:hypothetical protein
LSSTPSETYSETRPRKLKDAALAPHLRAWLAHGWRMTGACHEVNDMSELKETNETNEANYVST